MALDLRDARDGAESRELARRADVVIQNFPSDGLVRFGVDYASVHMENSSAVHCSISGFGSRPGRNVPGYDLTAQAVAGLMSLIGEPDGPPYRAGMSVLGVLACNYAVIGLTALRHRDVTGEGQHVEVNFLSSALTGIAAHSLAHLAGKVVPSRMDNAHPSVFAYEPFPAADNDLIVSAGNDGQFRKLCEVLGLPDVADDPRLESNVAGRSNAMTCGPCSSRSWRGKVRTNGSICRSSGRTQRSYQHHRRWLCNGGTLRARLGRHRGRGRPRGAYVTPPEHLVGHTRNLSAAAPELGERGAEVRAWLAQDQEVTRD
ncbi:CoA transferase [Streptomyces sp. NPDC002159]